MYDYAAMLNMAGTIDERAVEIAAVVNEFWSALKERMPEAFERPNEYALFKSGGVGPIGVRFDVMDDETIARESAFQIYRALLREI